MQATVWHTSLVPPSAEENAWLVCKACLVAEQTTRSTKPRATFAVETISA
jgi:hypothetical protein